MSEIFSNVASDLWFDIDEESLIPIFTEYINSFIKESNLKHPFYASSKS
jgi:hypothetical protein